MSDGMDPCRFCGSRMGCEKWCPNQGELIDTEALKAAMLLLNNRVESLSSSARNAEIESDGVKAENAALREVVEAGRKVLGPVTDAMGQCMGCGTLVMLEHNANCPWKAYFDAYAKLDANKPKDADNV